MSETVYDTRHIRVSDSRCDRLPVISDMRIIPVTGDFTIAEKYPAIPRIMKLSRYIS